MEIDSLEAEEDGVSVITIVLNTVEAPEIVEFLGTERVGDEEVSDETSDVPVESGTLVPVLNDIVDESLELDKELLPYIGGGGIEYEYLGRSRLGTWSKCAVSMLYVRCKTKHDSI